MAGIPVYKTNKEAILGSIDNCHSLGLLCAKANDLVEILTDTQINQIKKQWGLQTIDDEIDEIHQRKS